MGEDTYRGRLFGEGAIIFVFMWIVFPAFAGFMVFMGVSLFMHTLPVVAGGGTQGTFIAKHLVCSDSGRSGTACDWYGKFTSLDGVTVLPDARLEGAPSGMDVGTGAAAVYTYDSIGSTQLVYGKGNLSNFAVSFALVGLGAGYLANRAFVLFSPSRGSGRSTGRRRRSLGTTR